MIYYYTLIEKGFIKKNLQRIKINRANESSSLPG